MIAYPVGFTEEQMREFLTNLGVELDKTQADWFKAGAPSKEAWEEMNALREDDAAGTD